MSRKDHNTGDTLIVLAAGVLVLEVVLLTPYLMKLCLEVSIFLRGQHIDAYSAFMLR